MQQHRRRAAKRAMQPSLPPPLPLARRAASRCCILFNTASHQTDCKTNVLLVSTMSMLPGCQHPQQHLQRRPVQGISQGAVPLQAVLEGLDELWDESQYAEEFGLDAFVSKLSASTMAAR